MNVLELGYFGDCELFYKIRRLFRSPVIFIIFPLSWNSRVFLEDWHSLLWNMLKELLISNIKRQRYEFLSALCEYVWYRVFRCKAVRESRTFRLCPILRAIITTLFLDRWKSLAFLRSLSRAQVRRKHGRFYFTANPKN